MTEQVSFPLLFHFNQPLPDGVEAVQLLGGKGAGLVEMTGRLGLAVPPGFTITTAVCREYLAHGWPHVLDAALAGGLTRLGEQTGGRLGDAAAPLLVSVRSGAPVSMPGMMDTLLNVGLTSAVREALAQRYGADFAADTWLRFCRMYATIVLALPEAAVAQAAACDGSAAGQMAAAERVRALAAAAGGIPDQPMAQLRGAVEAVFRSWQSERARAFRRKEGISDDLGTAVTVQAMVFGNLDDRSGTGVVFTRDPATGAPGPYGDYLAGGQGEDVVAGSHRVSGLDALQRAMPAVYAELLAVLERLEHHYRDMCDVEFTVSGGHLYVLQTRTGRRSPVAAVRIAVAMAEDPAFPLSKAEAVTRIDAETLRQLTELGTVRPDATPLARGLAASPGVGTGVLCCDPDRAADGAAKGTAVVLARQDTSPADVHGMIGAAAIITTRGGVASHAAVVARGWAIPAVTSLLDTEVLEDGLRVGGQTIAEGEVITVDGGTGSLYLGDQRAGGTLDIPELRTLRSWAADLELELGDATPATDGEPEQRETSALPLTLLDLARTVQLKGLCTTERAAETLSVSPVEVEQMQAGAPTLFRITPRGLMLTPEGRAWVTEQLAAEQAAVNLPALEPLYAQFQVFNLRFKEVVSTWQLTDEAARSEKAWAEVVAATEAIDAGLAGLLPGFAVALPRLARYTTRFAAALAAMRAGDRTMLAAPMKDSYHTVWFEFHEELFALLGKNRAAEE